jgi:hypothetical protein
MPAEFAVGGSPITNSGTLAVTKATQSANLVYAGPASGAAVAPTFRALATADLPVGTGTVTSIIAGTGLTGGTITTSGTIALSTPVSIANGGTNATTAAAALANLNGLPLTGGTLTGNLNGTTATFSGNLTGGNLGTAGTLTAGNTAINGTLSVSGGISGSLSINTNLGVSGTSTLNGAVGMNSTLSVAGGLTAGAVTSAGNFYGPNAGFSIVGVSGGNATSINLYAATTYCNGVLSVAGGVTCGGHSVPVANNTYWSGLPSGSGNAWYNVAAYGFTNQSDIKYKTDIADLPDCLDFVRALMPKRYRFTNGPDEDRDVTHWGFVAQDVAAVLGGGNDFGGHRIDNGEQSIAYHELVAVLWKAVQELASRGTK